MSEPSQASNQTSPLPLVRPSEVPPQNHHVSTSASTTGPTAITPPLPVPRDEPETQPQDCNDAVVQIQSLSSNLVGLNTAEDYDDSKTNTPRLLAAKSGKSDLDSIPNNEETMLDSPSRTIHHLSSSLPSSSSFISPPFSHLIKAKSRSVFTEPTPAYIEPIERSQSNLGQRKGGLETKQTSTSSKTHPTNPTSSQVQSSPAEDVRPRSQGRVRYSGMSDISSHNGINEGDVVREDALRGARQEAFSEQRHRSSSRSSQGKVEKRIDATLAEAEPSSNTRSRKSSHILGLFKENTALQDAKKSKDKAQESVSNDNGDVSASNFAQTEHAVSIDTGGIHSVKRENGKEATTSPKRDSPFAWKSPETPKSREKRSPEGTQQHVEAKSPPVDSMEQNLDTSGLENPQEINHRASSTSKHNLPTRLFEEIRDHHNVATPFHNNFRANRLDTENLRREARQEETAASISVAPTAANAQKLSGSPEGDDEESDKEQISSALYYPHQAPSPDALEDVSLGESRKHQEPHQELDSQLPEPAIGLEEDKDAPEEVDINLQSRNRSRHLHGDLQQARKQLEEFDHSKTLEHGWSSASDSESESLDENQPSLLREDSSLTDDAEATPRASPNTRKNHLHSRARRHRHNHSGPLGAVELKPYNHQVGGHTTVFRFSKRAVCKQLTNRENVFYEVVERKHPELLKFLPR